MESTSVLDPEQTTYRLTELLERRIYTLRVVARELHRGSDAMVRLNLDEIHESLASVTNLGAEMRFLTLEVDRLRQHLRAQHGFDPLQTRLHDLQHRLPSPLYERLGRLIREHEEIRAQVQQINRVRGAFLRRSRRSVNVMMNFLGSCGETYRPAGSALESGMHQGAH